MRARHFQAQTYKFLIESLAHAIEFLSLLIEKLCECLFFLLLYSVFFFVYYFRLCLGYCVHWSLNVSEIPHSKRAHSVDVHWPTKHRQFVLENFGSIKGQFSIDNFCC